MSNENNQIDADQNAVPVQQETQQEIPNSPGNDNGQESFEDYVAKFEPHQQRVIYEAKELAEKAENLRKFIGSSPIFPKLPAGEKQALQAQLFHMESYLGTLTVRISAWQNGGNYPTSLGMERIGDFGTGNEGVFTLKYLAATFIDATFIFGNDPRRNGRVETDMEYVQMMAVKSIFSTAPVSPKN